MAFTHPWFLAGLAAVGLPVLIHMLTRARPRVIPYPTYHLLVNVGSGQQSLNRLRTWIVLALRALAVAAFVLTFAQPYLKAPGADVTPGGARRVVLVVDASMSMRAVHGGVPLFERARVRAAEVLAELEPGTEAAVVIIDSAPHALLPALTRNIRALAAELDRERVAPERGNPADALALAQRLLDGPGTVTVFSDFQRTNWAAVDLSRFAGLDLLLSPITESDVQNVGITAIEQSPPVPVESEDIEMRCQVFNATDRRRQETVRLDLQGVTRKTVVDLAPFASTEAAFRFSLPTAGVYPGRVTLEPDDLDDDNTRYFGADVRRALRVLLVGDDSAADPGGSTFYIAKALAPSDYVRTGLSVTTRVSQAVDRSSLESADLFILACPATLGGETLEVIARRVAAGASLAVFLDGSTAPKVLDALAGGSDGALAPPFQLTQAVDATGPQGDPFGEVSPAATALTLFARQDQGDLKALRFFRRWQTRDDPDRAGEVLIRHPDGSVALALCPAGQGTVLLANFSPAPAASDAAGSPLFPALLHELIRALRSARRSPENTPGRPWTIDVAGAASTAAGDAGAADLTVSAPDGQPVDATVIARGQTARLSVPPVRLSGHYSVRTGDRLLAVGVVNVDPRETDTRSMSAAELIKQGSGDGPSPRVAVVRDEGQLVTAGTTQPLWPHTIALAVAFFVAETLLLALWRRRASRRPTPAASAQREGRPA